MREIKFRAWGGTPQSDTPAMTEPFDFRQYVTYHEGAQERLLPTVGEDVIYMQYTGLKDKNGVEIYEGDVVSAMNNRLGKGVMLFVSTFRNNTATFAFREAHLNAGGDRYFYDALEVRDIEVMGNIYENSELLKAIED